MCGGAERLGAVVEGLGDLREVRATSGAPSTQPASSTFHAIHIMHRSATRSSQPASPSTYPTPSAPSTPHRPTSSHPTPSPPPPPLSPPLPPPQPQLDASDAETLLDAVRAHGVIVVKGQNLTTAEQVALTDKLGETVILPKSFEGNDPVSE